ESPRRLEEAFAMRTGAAFVTLLMFLAAAPVLAADPDGLGRALAGKLTARPRIAPETHTTDFGDTAIGCITLTRWELAQFGYPGHAFLGEWGARGVVWGAVLNRAGLLRCHIVGPSTGAGCYDFDICGIPDSACVQ